MRALLALALACLGLGTSLYGSGLTAQNHQRAERLHELQRECELRRAAIANMRVQVRGRVAGDPRAIQEALLRRASRVQAAQDGSGVSGSTSLGGSPAAGPGASSAGASAGQVRP
jgi:uncharacterized protein HemX